MIVQPSFINAFLTSLWYVSFAGMMQLLSYNLIIKYFLLRLLKFRFCFCYVPGIEFLKSLFFREK